MRWMGRSWCCYVTTVVVFVARTHLWSSCWHVALLNSAIFLDGELRSGTCAAAWILHLQSFPSKYHLQPEKVRSTFFHSWCPDRSSEILCWSAQWQQKFHLCYIQVGPAFWRDFCGAYGLPLVCCFLQPMFLRQWIAWSRQSFLDLSFLLCTKCWILTCGWL